MICACWGLCFWLAGLKDMRTASCSWADAHGASLNGNNLAIVCQEGPFQLCSAPQHWHEDQQVSQQGGRCAYRKIVHYLRMHFASLLAKLVVRRLVLAGIVRLHSLRCALLLL